MILIYRILSNILYPLILIFVFYRKLIKKEDPIRYKEKILISHFKVIKKKSSKLVWFHASSIGEFKSIIPIINQLNLNHQRLKFLITTSTLSSGNIAKEELKKINNAEHRYFPYDISFLIDKFLNLWNPDVIFLVDSEIWPNLILTAKNIKFQYHSLMRDLLYNHINVGCVFLKQLKNYLIYLICLFALILKQKLFRRARS